MKKYLILIFVLMSFGIYGQSITRSVGYSSTGLTTAQLNALPTSVKNLEPIIKDTDLGYYVTWDGSAWVALGGGTISITNGANTTVTGDGSESDPFQINASGDNLGNHSMTANIIPDSDITRSIGNITNNISSIYNRTYIFKPFSSTDPTYTTNLGQTFYRSDLGKIGYWNGSVINRLATEDQLATAGTDDQTAAEVPITDTGGNYTATDVEGALAENLNLSKANQSIPAATNRSVNTIDDGTFTLQQAGTDLLQIGGNNDDAVYVKALEAMSGSNTIGLVSPFALPVRDLTLLDATLYTNALVVSDADSQIYRSDGTTWNLESGGEDITALTTQVNELDDTVVSFSEEQITQNERITGLESPLLDMAQIVSNYTTVLSDNKRIIVGNSAVDMTVKINDTLYPPKTALVFNQINTGKMKIDFSAQYKAWAETNSKPLYYYQTDSVFQSLTMIKHLDSVWRPFGKGLKTWDASNLYTTANAASSINEANATTGWTAGSGSPIISVGTTSPTPQNGSYYILVTHDGATDTSATAQTLLPEIENGDTFTVTVYGSKVNSVNNANVSFSIRNSSGSALASGTLFTQTNEWNLYELSATANTAETYLRLSFFSTADPGDAAGVDHIVLEKN